MLRCTAEGGFLMAAKKRTLPLSITEQRSVPIGEEERRRLMEELLRILTNKNRPVSS